MKRFSETTKWEDPWFRKLKPKFKTFLLYLFDRCDNAGVWVVDTDLAATYVGEKIDAAESLKAFSGRVVDIGRGKWLIPQFVSFQYGILSNTCHPHKRVMESLAKHSLRVGEDGKTTLVTTLAGTTEQGLATLEEEEEDKDKEEEVLIAAPKVDEYGLDLPHHFRTPAFTAKWREWIDYRKTVKKSKDWVRLFQSQLEHLKQFPESVAIGILNKSLINEYQGLTQPDRNWQNGNHSHANHRETKQQREFTENLPPVKKI